MFMKLTKNNYWNNFCKKSRKINHVNILLPPDREIHRIFKKFLPINKQVEFIEIGCGLGNWCVYFKKYFKYKIYGIDYTEEGVRSCLRTLEKNKIVPQKIYLEDFTTYKFDKKFDVVFSTGFVEHFTNYQEVIQKHLDITKNGGFTIIIAPNIREGIYSEIQQRLNKKIWDGHIKIGPIELYNSISEKNKIIYHGYIGKVNFGVVNTHSLNYLVRIIYFTFSLLTRFIFKYFLFWIPENRLLSPYVLLIIKK